VISDNKHVTPIAICGLSNYVYVSYFYCQKTPEDGLLRPKHVGVLCFNILTDNPDTESIKLFIELTNCLR
jgi:hypothetical protein